MKVRNNQPPVILSGAKDLRGFLCYDDLRTTAEILRSAQDDISNSFTASKPFRAAGEGGWFTFVFSRWQEAALSGQGPFIDKCFRSYDRGSGARAHGHPGNTKCLQRATFSVN